MNYDQRLTHGLEYGRRLWNTIKHKAADHNAILDEMRNRQQLAATFSKNIATRPLSEEMAIDAVFLETMAWRVYMFGYTNLFLKNPGVGGEYAKRMKNDPKFHKSLEEHKLRMGPPGCHYPQNIFYPLMKCLMPQCHHEGGKYAVKQLKSEIRQEWELGILSKYKY